MNKLDWKDSDSGIEANSHGFKYSVYPHQDNGKNDNYYFADFSWDGFPEKLSLFELCTEEEAKELCQSHADNITNRFNHIRNYIKTLPISPEEIQVILNIIDND